MIDYYDMKGRTFKEELQCVDWPIFLKYLAMTLSKLYDFKALKNMVLLSCKWRSVWLRTCLLKSGRRMKWNRNLGLRRVKLANKITWVTIKRTNIVCYWSWKLYLFNRRTLRREDGMSDEVWKSKLDWDIMCSTRFTLHCFLSNQSLRKRSKFIRIWVTFFRWKLVNHVLAILTSTQKSTVNLGPKTAKPVQIWAKFWILFFVFFTFHFIICCVVST